MYFVKQKAFTYLCESEQDMGNAREKTLTDNPGYTVVKEKKDFKTKKAKGEIVDEFWLYTITLDLADE